MSENISRPAHIGSRKHNKKLIGLKRTRQPNIFYWYCMVFQTKDNNNNNNNNNNDDDDDDDDDHTTTNNNNNSTFGVSTA